MCFPTKRGALTFHVTQARASSSLSERSGYSLAIVVARSLALRRSLIWSGHEVGDYFHATTDKQIVRDAVFDLIKTIDVKVYAQILEKSKAQPNIRPTRERFYQYGWYYLFKFIAPRFVTNDTELMVTAASLGTRKERADSPVLYTTFFPKRPESSAINGSQHFAQPKPIHASRSRTTAFGHYRENGKQRGRRTVVRPYQRQDCARIQHVSEKRYALLLARPKGRRGPQIISYPLQGKHPGALVD